MYQSTGVHRAALAAILLLVLALVSVPTAANARTYVVDGSDFRFKPKALAPANHTSFEAMRWKRWSSSKAVGSGRGHTMYPGGDPIDGKVTLTLSQPKRMCGRTVFTKASWKYKGRSGTTTSYFNEFDGDSEQCGFWNGA